MSITHVVLTLPQYESLLTRLDALEGAVGALQMDRRHDFEQEDTEPDVLAKLVSPTYVGRVPVPA